MSELTNEQLDTLIAGLEFCYKTGVHDPWVLSDGTEIEPLHILYELRAFRLKVNAPSDPETGRSEHDE